MYFQKGCNTDLAYPVTEIPADSSGLVNPCIGKNDLNVPAPVMPHEDIEEFSRQLYEIVDVRLDVTQNKWPGEFFETYGIDANIPNPLERFGMIYDAQSAASAVHMDSPVDLGLVAIEWLNSEKAAFTNTVAGEGHTDFLKNPVGLISDLAVNVTRALEEAFVVKYFFGRPRPEEASRIGADFTHYPEGCPKHPAYVAGHGAAAGATYGTIAGFYDLTEEQDQILKTMTQHFAMYRSLAGVHYADDNLEGWRLGVAVAKDLPTVCDISI